jgi:hypothetical protein
LRLKKVDGSANHQSFSGTARMVFVERGGKT